MSGNKGMPQDKSKSHLFQPENAISRRELLKRLSPWGRVELDSSRCTGCALCALECPSGALTAPASEETNVLRLLFKHNLCVACGQCVAVCPEQCLHLERTLEMDGLNRPATVLFEDEIVRCAECGSPVGTKAMLAKLQVRVSAAGQSFPARPGLCPKCKVEALFGRLRA